MKFSIAKNLQNKMPADFRDVYFHPETYWFYRYAGILTIEDGEYWVEGPDEELKTFLPEEIERHGKQLYREEHGNDGVCFWTAEVPVPLTGSDESDLRAAVYHTVVERGYTLHTFPDPDLFRVTSVDEVRILRERYLAEKARKAGQ